MVSMEPETAHATMLTLARESRGMTQLDVAKAMSALAGERISQGYVSKAESGRLKVSGARLELYGRALRYPPGTLCVDADVHGVGIGLVHHRKKAALGAQALRRIHAELALTRLQVRGLVPSVTEDVHHFERVAVTDLESPSDAARTLRKLWNLPEGPVSDLVQTIEQAGGLVLIRDLGTRDVDAVSQWNGVEAPLFLLNAHAPGDRFRFSLGHELGHIVMHPEPGATTLQERQADEFASEFLMPAADIAADLRNGLDLNRLLALKHRWGVSMAALVRRAVTLAAISDWQYRNLMVEMSTLGYRTHEPGDLARERPDKVTTIVERLTHAQGLDRVAVTAGLLPEEFRRLYLSDAAQDGDSPDADTVHEVHR
ncbi:XRE family transcriptional regulator [Actinoallomurus sp. NBC_01490]|uniref:ImmA/IrrE family metallo-endopeptidase n=1 Tax=Actinoallomurus sp. NBC_01490 TaxID=2903557 RepID=UPI002E325EE8|nr:XRE family transcriptional regulator [Actinoallomurus sp. NBC_01490]